MTIEMSGNRVLIPLKDLIRIVGLISHRVDFSKRHMSNYVED